MIPEKIKAIMTKLEENDYEAYIIGGAIRDYILGIEPHDYDIFTNATGEQIKQIFPKGIIIGSQERQEKILTVIVDGVEISQYRKNGDRTKTGTTLLDHLSTCDLTINSLAMDINEDVIDKYNGVVDIHNNIIKFVGKPIDRINEDKLRLLRAIRIGAKYKFKFEQQTGLAIELNSHKILDLPQERVSIELMKILLYPKGIEYLIFYGFLDHIFPEFEKVKGMNGGMFHSENVHTHLLNAFNESCKITDNVNLRLACFLHDIGKGETYTENHICPKCNDIFDIHYNECICGYTGSKINKQIHFYEHEKVGEELMKKRLKILKFGSNDINYITTLIRLHMYSYKDTPGKKSYIKFFAKLESANIPIEDYIMLIYCDNQSNASKPRIKFGDFIKGNWLYKKYYEIKFSEEPMTVKDLKISGKDIIEQLNLSPGPKIGEILNNIFEEVMDGNIKNNRAELLNYIKSKND